MPKIDSSTSGSWLNRVEIFFGIITRQAIRRGTFTSVKDLIAAIKTYIDGWNERCQPFAGTKTADDILTNNNRRSKIIVHATLERTGIPLTLGKTTVGLSRSVIPTYAWTIRRVASEVIARL